MQKNSLVPKVQFPRLVQILSLVSLMAGVLWLSACSNSSGSGGPGAGSAEAPASDQSKALAEDVAKKYGALDTSNDSTQKLKVTIKDDSGAAKAVDLVIYNKRKADGSRSMFVEFDSPAEERDRDALIEVDPKGNVQATRYTQSSKSFLTAKSPTDEESLFGMTLQELVGGQPEKYGYTLLGEDTHNGTPVYKLEGKLKAGVESRFPRIVMLIDKQNYAAEVIEAYDSQNQLARRITADKTEQVDGIWTRMNYQIDNIADKKTMNFAATSVKYNQNLPDSVFDRDHLKKLATKTEG
ncbi:MAG TPA: outer membrane lipoprotein-sorting protein [Blastocatellia bacterium]|nr:outer membrane lipoprotein-sorting protein [Blastocatellia bacterium]